MDKKGSETKWLKTDYNNLIHLCPICHRQIHHGTAEDVKNMIDEIYDKNKKWFDGKLKKYAGQDNYLDVLKWIYHIYDRERCKNNYEELSKSEI